MKKLTFMISLIGMIYSCSNKSSSKLTTEDSLEIKHRVDSIMISAKSTDSLGIWQLQTYVDEFKQPTKEHFISATILGSFSNSATQNSDLRVEFLINKESDVNIMMYEYNDSNPVKSSIEDGYLVRLKAGKNDPLTLHAVNRGDRLHFNASDSKKICQALSLNTDISFAVREISQYSASEYFFKIDNSTGFQKAMSKLSI